MKEVILPAYRQGRVDANKQGAGGVAIGLGFSFKNPEKILKTQWRSLGILRKDSWSIADPLRVEAEGKKVTVDEVRKGTHLCKNWSDVLELVDAYVQLGVTAITFFTGADTNQIHLIADNILSVF
jgi:hypothetical protein